MMESVAKVLKAETDSPKANLFLSGAKFAGAAALAWKILPMLPQPKAAAVMTATVATLGLVPDWKHGQPNTQGIFQLQEDFAGYVWDLGLISLVSGVQLVALAHSIKALQSIWQTSRAVALPVGALVAYSLVDFVWDKGLFAKETVTA